MQNRETVPLSAAKEFVLNFLELYRSFPCLWKVKSEDYHNKDARGQAYNVLIQKLKEIDKNADQEAVKKKINALRTNYRKELKKVLKSRKSGAGEDEVYTPQLYYFEELDFLRDQETPRESISNLNDVCLPEHDQSLPNTSPNSLTRTDTTTPSTSGNQGTSNGRTCNNPFASKRAKRRKGGAIEDELLLAVTKKLSEEEPKSLVMAKNWARQFDELDCDQQIHAEKLFNDVLYEAKLKNLNKFFRIMYCIQDGTGIEF